jgi:hypothetical protein
MFISVIILLTGMFSYFLNEKSFDIIDSFKSYETLLLLLLMREKKKLFLFYVEFSIFAIKLHIVCIRRIPLFNLPEYPFQEQR